MQNAHLIIRTQRMWMQNMLLVDVWRRGRLILIMRTNVLVVITLRGFVWTKGGKLAIGKVVRYVFVTF